MRSVQFLMVRPHAISDWVKTGKLSLIVLQKSYSKSPVVSCVICLKTRFIPGAIHPQQRDVRWGGRLSFFLIISNVYKQPGIL